AGMSQTLLDDLSAGLAALEKTLEESRAGRRDHVGASTEMSGGGDQIFQQVKLLNGLVRSRFRSSPELMGAWASAKNVFGPPHQHVDTTAGGTPAGTGDTPVVVAPAA